MNELAKALKLDKQLERDFQRDVIKLAELSGWRVYHVVNVKGQLRNKTSVGYLDLTLTRERTMFAELKREGEDLTDDQQIWFDLHVAAGDEVYVWRPSDFQDIARILARRK